MGPSTSMSSSSPFVAALTLWFLVLSSSCTWNGATAKTFQFLLCMLSKSPNSKLYAPNTTAYSSVLKFSLQNLRFATPTTPKPFIILTPKNESEIISALVCSRKYGLQIRVRSGGHDYEGQSSTSADYPFVLIDLITFRSIQVDLEQETAWVQAGATLGELYYTIASDSKTLGFPAGTCPTVGVGGHITGGGLGNLVRKYGLAADNVLDAQILDISGRILNRKSMGEDLFWAIRGGGSASFGIVLSWKLKLVHVPPIVTVFSVHKTLEQGATSLVSKWQEIADKLHENLFIRIIAQPVKGENKSVETIFQSLYLGESNTLLELMEISFPELGLTAKDCLEMNWIESVLYFAGYDSATSLEVLRDRGAEYKTYFKCKSDFLSKPIPQTGLEGAWQRILGKGHVYMIMEPFGGIMNNISESEIPFPHRKGNLGNIQYGVKWKGEGTEEANKHITWIRELYRYMSPYISSSPRAAYINYRDLDIGRNDLVNASYWKSTVWGIKYFKDNFKRLALIKGKFDPDNYFRNEQSIPPLHHSVIKETEPEPEPYLLNYM